MSLTHSNSTDIINQIKFNSHKKIDKLKKQKKQTNYHISKTDKVPTGKLRPPSVHYKYIMIKYSKDMTTSIKTKHI